MRNKIKFPIHSHIPLKSEDFMEHYIMVLLLTGATGFLGSYLLEDLSEFDLRVITRNKSKIQDSTVEVVEADITKPLDTTIFDDVDILIHSAAKVGSWPKNPKLGYYQTNVEATKNIISMAIDHEVENIIYTSSYFALGPTGKKIRDETWDRKPRFSHPYITTKYQAGKIVDELSKSYPITQILPTIIIGKGIDNPISNNVLDYINGRLPGLPGGGKSRVNFVSADDVARAHLMAINSKTKGKYIIGGENMSYFDFFYLFGKKLEINPPRNLPLVFARMYAYFQELTDRPKVTRGEIKALNRNFQFSSERARKELSFQPHSIEDAVDKMIVSFLQHENLNDRGERRILNYLNSKF